MNYDWIIIDGNNLLHTPGCELPGAAGFEQRRWALARRLTELVPLPARRITLVYDGSIGGRDDAFDGSPLEVVYTPRNSTADALIERLVCERPAGCRVLVVTSDHMERDTVEAAGAEALSCAGFLHEIERPPPADDGAGRFRNNAPPATLADFFPHDD